MLLSTQTINDKLTAASANIGQITVLQDKSKAAREAIIANTATVLGNNLDPINGYQSLEVLHTQLQSIDLGVDYSTATALIKLAKDAQVLPQTAAKDFTLAVATGSFTTVDLDIVGDILTVDSAENETIVSGVIGQIPSVTSTGTDAVQNVDQTVSSLTGITPPTEVLQIGALGGGAVSALTASVKEATERKKSLLGEIKSAASASSVEGLTDDFNSSMSDLEGTVNDAINNPNITADITEAVSAVEGLGDTVAQAAAEANDSLIGELESTLGQVTNAIEDGFAGVLAGVEQATNDLLQQVESAVNTGLGFAQDLFEDITGNIGSTLQNIFPSSIAIGPDIISSVIDDIVSGGDIDLTNATKRLALLDESLDPKVKEAIQETEAQSPSEFQQKVKAKAKAKGASDAQIAKFTETSQGIETALSQVQTTIAGQIVSEVGSFYTEDTDLAELIKRYVGANTKDFAFIDSKEELELEMYRMTREVSEIVVHATETYTNSNIGSEEIHLRHKEAGHEKGIQYHLVIRRDGRLQRGMPLDQISDASNIRGHALNCIDVCLVGGVNVPTDEDNPLENLSSQSFTQAQMKTLEAVMEGFYHIVSGGQVIGHNNLSLLHEDPYFDVVSFVENKFGKKTVYNDLFTEQSLSRKELVSKKPI